MDSSSTHELASQFPTFRRSVAASMAGYRQRLADRINAELNAKAMSVDDLAYKSGVSDKTIKRLLLAKHDARPSTRRRLAEGLDLDPGELSPEAEADQLRRLEEKLDEVLAFLRADEKAERVSALAGEAAAEAKPPARRTRRKPRAASG